MWYRLGYDIVHRDESPLRPERLRHCGGDVLHKPEEVRQEIRRQIDELRYVRTRDHQHMPFEDGPAVEETDPGRAVHDLERGHGSRHDRAEEAVDHR